MTRPLLISIFCALVCSAPAADKNIIFYIADDLGAYLGCYGYPQVKTPHMDALAADGTLFTNAYATTASCSASRSVVMTGLHNHSNGQYGHQHDFHKFACWPNTIALALPQVMRRAGYRTAHAGKHHVAPAEVFDFGLYLSGDGRNTVQQVNQCADFIKEKSDQPFFLYIGCADPHRGGGSDESSPLQHRANLFGNKPNQQSHPGVKETFYQPEEVFVPPFLPDTPTCRAELVQYYQSVSRVDQGIGRLVEVLKEAGLYDKTLIVITSDHGMAFPGGKTTVYEPGLKVPFIVRNPYTEKRGVKSDALVSHVDITPSLLDFAGGLDREKNAPRDMLDPAAYWKAKGVSGKENLGPRRQLDRYQGRSWIDILEQPTDSTRTVVHGSHTFHEIQMYYPMRSLRDAKYKIIWNIANPLPYPFASDLWAAASWQAQYEQGPEAKYGAKTVREYIHRPPFELYDMTYDPDETKNLAAEPEHQTTLEEYKAKLKAFQKKFGDPWIQKWDYE
jgi:N-sulfoglucosamine sulfohydrolase